MALSATDLIALSMLPRIGSKTLLEAYKASLNNNATNVFDVDWTKPGIVKGKIGKALEKMRLDKNIDLESLITDAETKMEKYIENGISVLSIGDEAYPCLLKHHTDPPPLLYCRGDLRALKRSSIAIVGTRQPTTLGTKIAEKTTSYFANHGVVIVSGLATGVDSIVHRTTLDKNGTTIAVLVDIENISPASNSGMARDICDQGGLVLSENPPGSQASPGAFVRRDRIQSGLCPATIVIESKRDGGSLHAGNDAIDNNRRLYIPNYNNAGYSDSNQPEIEGLKQLKERGALFYTKADYESILQFVNASQMT